MPELPEVETIRRQLDEVLPGKTIVGIEVLKEKSFVGNARNLIGQSIQSVERRAKVLRIGLKGKLSILIHLKMTGQLIYQPKKVGVRVVGGHPSIDWVGALPSKHTRVILRFNTGTLYFNDQRIFGWMKLVNDSELEKEHATFGPDIIDSHRVTPTYFFSQLKRSKTPVKMIILDQRRFAGVGNIYANDGLYAARIDPRKSGHSLTRHESDTLLRSLNRVMRKGIKFGGASETNFLHVNGMGGKYQEHFLVYKKQGIKCRRKACTGTIQKIILGGRGTYFCPQCQK